MQSTSSAFEVEYSPSQEETGAHRPESLWSRKHAGKVAIAAILPGILLIATPFLLLGNTGHDENRARGEEPARSSQLSLSDEMRPQNLRQPGLRSRVQLEEQPGGPSPTYYYQNRGAVAPSPYYAAPTNYGTPTYNNRAAAPSPYNAAPTNYGTPTYYYGAPNAYQQQSAAQPAKGTDDQALSYDNAPNKMATLHALAQASREAQNLKRQRQMSPTQQWTQGMMTAKKADDVLSQMHGGGAELHEAKARISKVLAQAVADRQFRKQVLRTAAEAAKGGSSNTAFDKMLHREVGPQSVQMASDWLSTEVAAAPKGAKKTMFARAQLEAALSRVGGKFKRPTAETADSEGNLLSRGENKGLAFEQQASQRVMSRAESVERNGQLFGRGLTRHSGMGSYSGGWQPPQQQQAYSPASYSPQGQGEGQPSGNGKAGNSGVAPGLSSYDAQILSNGPPS